MPPSNEVALDEATTGTGVGWAPETARERSACLESPGAGVYLSIKMLRMRR